MLMERRDARQRQAGRAYRTCRGASLACECYLSLELPRHATRPQRALRQRQLAIPVRCQRFAARAKGWVAAAVAHDPTDLLALDITVDAGHPRVDLGEQQALARGHDVVG